MSPAFASEISDLIATVAACFSSAASVLPPSAERDPFEGSSVKGRTLDSITEPRVGVDFKRAALRCSWADCCSVNCDKDSDLDVDMMTNLPRKISNEVVDSAFEELQVQ